MGIYLTFFMRRILPCIVVIYFCIGYTSVFPHVNFTRKPEATINPAEILTVNPERHGACKNKTVRKSLFYIKIQKTGSTTLKSSLYNYGLKHNLRICVDATDIHHMNFPYSIDMRKLTKTSSKPCDLIADELVYNKEQAKALMRDNPFIMASVREPVSHFISVFKFARIQHAVHMLTLQNTDFWDSIRVYLKYPDLVRNIYATYKEEELLGNMPINLIRPNLQMFSLGLNSTSTLEEIKSKADQIDLFVVAEMYSESMVVLSEKLCCPFEDLVYVKQNIQRRISEDNEIIPTDIISLIKEYNKGDMWLYEMAKKRLEKSISNYKNFQNDLTVYNHAIKAYSVECETRQPLAKISNNYCLQEGATYFFQVVREKQKKKLLEELQRMYETYEE